jgi:Cys-Gly metallodipeptidase DUG1
MVTDLLFSWLGTEKPCLTYGLRGCSYYKITVSGPAADLHSGVFGGTVTEPMTDLVSVLNTLVDNKGKIKIEGIDDLVAPLTDEEKALFPNIAFTMDDIYTSLGSKTTIHDDPVKILMARYVVLHERIFVHVLMYRKVALPFAFYPRN